MAPVKRQNNYQANEHLFYTFTAKTQFQFFLISPVTGLNIKQSDPEENPISKKPKKPRPLPLGLEIIFEDRDLLAVDKPAGLLSMASEREKVKTAYYTMTDYVRKGNSKSRNRLFIVHRLDRETSGVLLFAKSEEAKVRLQDHWEDVEKTYLAVVHGSTPAASGSITSYLAENDAFRVYSTPDESKGKFSQTDYRVLKKTPAYSFLEIHLQTGRKNQIRVHCAEQSFPVVGDKKYGREGDNHTRLALHSYTLQFQHPVNGRTVSLKAALPPHFGHLLGPIADCLPETTADAPAPTEG